MNLNNLLGIDLTDPAQKLASDMMDSQAHMLDRLVAERQKQGLSQADLGKKMGVTQSAVAKMESGARDPHLSTLRRYAAALDMRITFAVEEAVTARGWTPIVETPMEPIGVPWRARSTERSSDAVHA